MTGVFMIKGKRDTDIDTQEERRAKIEAEMGVMHHHASDTKDYQQHQKLRERQEQILPLEPSGRAWAY